MYRINDTDLIGYGAFVKSFTGWESVPKRKGDAYYNYPDEEGIEPFLDDGEVFFEPRSLVLDVYFLADTVLEAQVNILEFQDQLKLSFDPSADVKGIQFENTSLGRVFVCLFHNGATTKRITRGISGHVCYLMSIKLTEISNYKKDSGYYVTTTGDFFTDNNGNKYFA